MFMASRIIGPLTRKSVHYWTKQFVALATGSKIPGAAALGRLISRTAAVGCFPGLGKRLVPELVAVPRESHRRFDSAQALSNLAG